jgi:Na+/H+-dicarboxylate symporter
MGLGFGLGLWTYKNQPQFFVELIPACSLTGKLWLCALITLAIPLVSSYLYSIISSMSGGKFAGKIGGHALIFHVLIMIAGVIFTLITSHSFNDLITGGVSLTTSGNLTDQIITSDRTSKWLLYADAYQLFIAKLILPTLLIVTVQAVVLSRFLYSFHTRILRYSALVSSVSLRAMNYVLLFIPLAACVLTFTMAAVSGYALAGLMGRYVLALIIMLLVLTFLLYFIAALFGGVPIKKFVRVLFPAQVVAASTRSSLATMPVLLERASHAALPSAVSGLVIPLSVTVFRLNRSVSSVFSYIFLTTVYAIPTDASSTLTFLLLIMVLSFGSPGVPSGGKFATMPVFLALGVPLEMIVLTKAIDAIPDIFKTVLNVTEAMTIASLVTRSTSINPVPHG